MKRCPDCRRLVATEVDWRAYSEANVGSCPDELCCWGGDRCWYENGCGFQVGAQGPGTVLDLTRRGKALRRRRPLTRVPHAEAHEGAFEQVR